jgi:hypothetical protein
MRAPSHPARVAALLLASVSAVTGTFAELTPSSTVLTNAAQILHLTAAQAARALPVRLRGVVVDESQPREKALILADQTARRIIGEICSKLRASAARGSLRPLF